MNVLIVFLTLFIITQSQKLQEQKIQSYTTCTSDSDCKPNSFCFGNDDNQTGKCKCFEGFELIRNTTYYECLKGVKLGDACEQHIQCEITASKLAACTNKICSCNQFSHSYADGMCYLISKLGDLCVIDYNCYLSDGKYGYCVDGRCACPSHQRPSQNRTYCISSKRIGETCLSDEECGATPNAKCQEVCRCGLGYILARSGKECIKAATNFGEECSIDAQCSEYLLQSVCLSGHCGCIRGFHSYGNRCARTRKIGEQCEEDPQCIYERKLDQNIKCDNKKCTCIFGKNSDGDCNIEKIPEKDSSVKLTGMLSLILTVLYFGHRIFS